MTQIIIILGEDGKYEGCLTDSEISVQVLKRGQDDTKIDQYEASFEWVDEE